jgi:hypothetical protein
MKKYLLSLMLMFAVCICGMAQTIVFSDNFDSYTVGNHLAQSNSAWTTWSHLPGSAEDGIISNDQAVSTPNSLFISGSNDQVYPFGNYTTGHYLVSFNYFVPSTGNGAYFNIQHVLLQEWAFSCNFYNNGDGYLKVGNAMYTFTCPSDTWFPIAFDLDMDNDQASLTINNTPVHTWPFHYQELDTNGTNQLAGINLYAGSPNSGVSGTYYVDDFVVTELSAAQVGEFDVSIDNITVSMAPNSMVNRTFTMSNPGTGETDFRIVTIYDIPNPDPTSTGSITLKHCQENNPNQWGWYYYNDVPVEIALGFSSDSLQSHIGKTINEIDVFFMTSAITTASVRVYAMDYSLSYPAPGQVLCEQTFTPDSGWNHVQLTNPVLLDGSDLWIGAWFLHPIYTYPVAVDYGATDEYSGWTKTSNTWTRYNNNYLIMGKIDGTPINPWISVSQPNGTINAGGEVTENVNINSNNMQNNETHTAKLHCYSSDIENGEVIIPVTLTIADVAVNEHNQIEVSVYPNPATDFVQVTSDQIQRVEIYNMMGQKVFENNYCDHHVVIPTSNLAPGTYAVTVYSNEHKFTKQVIIR